MVQRGPIALVEGDGRAALQLHPGSGSNRDWAPESEKSFVPSKKIIDDILVYEKRIRTG